MGFSSNEVSFVCLFGSGDVLHDAGLHGLLAVAVSDLPLVLPVFRGEIYIDEGVFT